MASFRQLSSNTMCDNQCEEDIESIPLPKGWSKTARHAVLNVMGIVRVAMLAGREFLIQNGDALEAHVRRLETEVALLREESRIIGTRMARIAPRRRPQYLPVERMAIMNCVRCDSSRVFIGRICTPINRRRRFSRFARRVACFVC